MRIWGAARNLSATTGTNLGTMVEETFEQFQRPTARGAVDPEAADRLAREGAAMSVDEAVAYALGGEVPEGA